LEPRKREAIVAAREKLLTGGPKAEQAAIERWIADEQRFETRLRSGKRVKVKSRSDEPASPSAARSCGSSPSVPTPLATQAA
jgi:hypothetical protein